MGRTPSCSKDQGMNKGAWTAIEDRILTDYIKLHGEGKWRHIPKRAGLKRCGKSCRLRWMNYLRPDIKRGNISHDEEDLIIRLHKLLGNRWSLIAGRLPGRTDNEIKNYWNTHLSKGGQKKQRETKTNHSEVDKEPIISSTVIRTKASRCREVFINPDCYQQPRFGNHVKTVNLEHVVEEESETSNGSITTMPSFKEDNCLGFMMDADAGEISVSEIFSPEMGNVMQGEVDVDNYLSTFAVPQEFFLAEEVEHKWSGTDYIQEHLDSDFESFLESAEEWLL